MPSVATSAKRRLRYEPRPYAPRTYACGHVKVDNAMIWQTILDDLPPLRVALERLFRDASNA